MQLKVKSKNSSISFFVNIQRNISNTDLNSLATIFDIKLSNKKCQKWAAGFLAHNGTYEEQKMIFQTTRTLTSAEDKGSNNQVLFEFSSCRPVLDP